MQNRFRPRGALVTSFALVALFGVVAITPTVGCTQEVTIDEADLVAPPPNVRDDGNVALGIPTDTTPQDDLIIDRPQYTISYSPYLHNPNWASWHLRKADFGAAPRNGAFYSDPQPPGLAWRVKPADYGGSGFDIGHVVPSEQRTATTTDNRATFFMANVVPQPPDANRGPWAGLERFAEHLVTIHNLDLYVVAGPVYGNPCRTHAPRTAGDGCADMGSGKTPDTRIAVPTGMFKIMVAVPAGAPLSSAVDGKVVAAIVPNNAARLTNWVGPQHVPGSVGDPAMDYVRSVADIEAATGYTFLSALPGGGAGLKKGYFNIVSAPSPTISEAVCAPAGTACDSVFDCCTGSCGDVNGARVCK